VGLRVEDATNLVGRIGLYGTTCDNNHPNYGVPTHRAIGCTAISLTAQGELLEWLD
jgi:hypothetical protein